MIYVCVTCGKLYNSDTLKSCPFCNSNIVKDLVIQLVKDEGFIILVKTIADEVANKVMNQHEEDYEHKEVKE